MKNKTFLIIVFLVVFLSFSFNFVNTTESKYREITPNYKIHLIENQFEVFNFTGNEQIYEIPVSGFYYVSTWGGNGGLGGRGQSSSLVQSAGGISQEISGVYYFTAGEKLYIYVASAGVSAPSGNGTGTGFAGGTNGLNIGNNSGHGGQGGAGYKHLVQSNYSGAGGGGGAGTFILKQSQQINSILLASAGGGGGGRRKW